MRSMNGKVKKGGFKVRGVHVDLHTKKYDKRTNTTPEMEHVKRLMSMI